ncbi:MAG: phytanoyl-CoA dioxygenase family protein [Polyangiales bacterium]
MPMDRSNTDDDLATLHERGWVIGRSQLVPALLVQLRAAMETAYRVCREVQVRNGIAEGTDGTVHHLPAIHDAFLSLLDPLPERALLQAFFGGPFILNSFGGVLNRQGAGSYVGRVHRDLRFFSAGQPMMLNMLVLLDDFTAQNGATYLLTGSHRSDAKPDDQAFVAGAERLLAQAGSVAVFDSNLWHAAGVNQTTADRRALTLTFTRPFLKPQLDYARQFGYDAAARFSPDVQQLLGYNSRVPASLDEWYQPPERRFYKPGQG